jgi:uncharacterized membrane protein
MKHANVEPKTGADEDSRLIGACCVALGTLVPVAMYQTGLLRRLPDPPMRVFDSARITMSKAAHPLGIPDGLLGVASFSATLMLAIVARRHRRARTLLGAKLVVDASAAAFNACRQVFLFGKLCSWCMGTVLSTGVMAYAGRDAIKEATSTVATMGESAGCRLHVLAAPPEPFQD